MSSDPVHCSCVTCVGVTFDGTLSKQAVRYSRVSSTCSLCTVTTVNPKQNAMEKHNTLSEYSIGAVKKNQFLLESCWSLCRKIVIYCWKVFCKIFFSSYLLSSSSFGVRNTSSQDFLTTWSGIAVGLLLDSRPLGSVGLGSEPLGCGRRHVDFFSGLA